jgi:hypothetical protein
VDMPLQELEEVGAKYLSKFEVDVGYHQPPGRDGMTPLDLALLAGAAGTFVLSSIWLGIIKKSGIPQDQIQAMEFAQSRAEARKEVRPRVAAALAPSTAKRLVKTYRPHRARRW